ncbi:hypothetical protein OQA88_772 [Cercophora sp. LCS_1]
MADSGLDWAVVLAVDATDVYLTPVGAIPAQDDQSFWSFDLVATLTPPTTTKLIPLDLSTISSQHTPLFTNLTGHLKATSPLTIRLLLPLKSGAPIRSDLIPLRLASAPLLEAHNFLTPLTPIPAIPQTTSSLLTLLPSTLAALVSIPATPLTPLLTQRLSLPLLTATPPPRKRIFWIQGRANLQSSQQFYQAAYALGISLVVLDAPGHWMQPSDTPWSHYREAFIEFDISGDPNLTQRIVDAVRAYPHKVDGIVTISDVRLSHVAAACEILGLPTEPASAFRIAVDKGATRQLEGDEGFTVHSVDELPKDGLDYPLVVKPCTGWNSDCVVKVRDRDELENAVRRASQRHATGPIGNSAVVVEPYIDGPEVDANFVVLNGEVLFYEITDDFPCLGDVSNGVAANFFETLMVVPSALPTDEQDLLRRSLENSIKRCGFKNGVFHCEARARNSRARYEQRQNGALDLVAGRKQKDASCYLHEINPRTPGYANSVGPLFAYGVDYYAIWILLALEGEEERIRALARPFAGGKPQYHLGIEVLPPTREGIMASEDAVGEFLDANPEIGARVVYYQNIKDKGDVVQGPDSSELWCVGYIIVAADTREECLALCQRIRERFDYTLVGE